MKTDRKLKLENLDSELFIAELGKVHGGQASMTSLAGSEDPSWNDTPWAGPRPPLSDYADPVNDIFRKVFGGTGGFPSQGEVTTQSLGEE